MDEKSFVKESTTSFALDDSSARFPSFAEWAPSLGIALPSRTSTRALHGLSETACSPLLAS